MTQATVAIITRTKDRPLLLRRAVDGILGQSYQDWLHVIVNDGGDPAAVASVIDGREDAYRGRLIRIDHPHSLGMEAASNAGIRACDSRLLIIHDDDDAWHPDFLARMVPTLDGLAERFAGVICHATLVEEEIQGDQVKEVRSWPFNAHLEAIDLALMARRNLFPPISFLFRRAAYDAVGPYRDDLRVLGDWEFNLRFLRHFDIFVLPEALAFYHHRLASQGGIYANTVIGQLNSHRQQEALLRNELIRQDLDQGRIGLGTLTMLASVIEAQVVGVPPEIAGDFGLSGPARQAIASARQRADAAEDRLRDAIESSYRFHAESARLHQEQGETSVRLGVATARAAQTEQQRLSLEHQLTAMQQSTSWRLTAPLRWIMGRLRG